MEDENPFGDNKDDEGDGLAWMQLGKNFKVTSLACRAYCWQHSQPWPSSKLMWMTLSQSFLLSHAQKRRPLRYPLLMSPKAFLAPGLEYIDTYLSKMVTLLHLLWRSERLKRNRKQRKRNVIIQPGVPSKSSQTKT